MSAIILKTYRIVFPTATVFFPNLLRCHNILLAGVFLPTHSGISIEHFIQVFFCNMSDFGYFPQLYSQLFHSPPPKVTTMIEELKYCFIKLVGFFLCMHQSTVNGRQAKLIFVTTHIIAHL